MKTNTVLTNIVKNLAFSLVAVASFTGFAQEEEEEKKFSLSGSVDAYYRANLTDEQNQAPVSSFANRPGFALGMANLIASYDSGDVGFVADLVFGPRGEEAVFLSPFGSSNIVNQLYVYWNVTENTKLTFGNFNTFLGYEVISPTGNFNYSTSYMFSYGPFSHAGLKADFTLDDDWSLMLGVFNPTDLTDGNFAGVYNYGVQLGYQGIYLNAIYGKLAAPDFVNGGTLVSSEPTFQIDLTAGFDLSEDFYLGVNSTYNDTDGSGFYGVALYPQLKTSEDFTIGLRAEYFAEFDGAGIINTDADGDGNIFAATLTGSYTKGDLTIKPEIRFDSASEETFIDSDGLPTEKGLGSFLLAAIYSF